jgi:hypothetical protein
MKEKLETVAEAHSRRFSQASTRLVLEEASPQNTPSRERTLRGHTRSPSMLSGQLAEEATKSIEPPTLSMESVTTNES